MLFSLSDVAPWKQASPSRERDQLPTDPDVMTSQPPRAPCAADQACRLSVIRHFPAGGQTLGCGGLGLSVAGREQRQFRWLPGTVSGHGRGIRTGRTGRMLLYIATTQRQSSQGTCSYNKSCLVRSSQSDALAWLVGTVCFLFIVEHGNSGSDRTR